MLEEAIKDRATTEGTSAAAAVYLAPRRRIASWQALSPADRLLLLAGVLRVGDFLAVPAGAVLAYQLRYASAELAPRNWVIVLFGALLNVCCLHMLRSYDAEVLRSWARQLPRLCVAWTATILLVISLLYFAKLGEEFSRAWLGLWLVSGLLPLLAVRLAGAATVAYWQRERLLVRRVALVNVVAAVERRTQWIEQSLDVSLVLTRRYTPEAMADIIAAARNGWIDEIVIATTGNAWQATEKILASLSGIAVTIKLYHDAFEIPFLPGKVELLCGRPVFEIAERPLAGGRQIAKRAEDIVLSSLLLVLALPLMLLIALAIKLDSRGPVLFRQRRFGFNGQVIRVYKFRSMRHRDEPDHLMVQARRNDDRVTRVGAVLRRLSFDELPQLFNVLAGEMSLVGPRPHPVALDERFADRIDGYLGRHRVKPGITGWAQINGLRGETDTNDKMQRRIQFDLYYINHWSLLLDFRILLFTVLIGWVDENAY